jgi:predicted nucleic acid-binding protein
LPISGVDVVVSDAGPLISLGRLNLLSLLPALFAQVQVPKEVLAECLARPDQADTVRVMAALAAGWLQVCVAVPLAEPAELGLGERAAIGRALEIGAGLLADDFGARHYARAHGLAVIGTLGVLAIAKRAGHLPRIAPLIEQLRAGGQRLSQAAVADALAMAGETPP